MPTLVQYACFACRKVFKRPIAALSVVGYPCPSCAQPLNRMGSAFRAPRRADELQWRKVEKLVRAGILFCRNSGPRPRSLNGVAAFLQDYARAKQSAGERIMERIGQLARQTPRQSQSRLKWLNAGGKAEFKLAGRELRSCMTVLVREGNQWLKGIFRSTGDGGKTVQPHVKIGQKRIFIGRKTVLCWPE